jgi:hypothetical protein
MPELKRGPISGATAGARQRKKQIPEGMTERKATAKALRAKARAYLRSNGMGKAKEEADSQGE